MILAQPSNMAALQASFSQVAKVTRCRGNFGRFAYFLVLMSILGSQMNFISIVMF